MRKGYPLPPHSPPVLQGSPLTNAHLSVFPPRIATTAERSHNGRRGLTLLELMVALALLGLMLALVTPLFRRPTRRDGRLDAVLRAARATAISRSETMALRVRADGQWSVRALPPDDALLLLSGTLDSQPSLAFQLQLTPLGACLPTSSLPAEFAGWDAAGCRPLREQGRVG